MWRNRKHHSVFLSSLLLSLVAYWGQGSVAAHWLSSRPLRMSSKTNHQWEVKLLQCHSGNPRWSRHTSSAKDKKKKNVSQLVHWGLSLKPWMNKLNKSYKYDWECVHPESLKEQQSGFWASFILADCWPHGWGSWALRSSGCCERNTELCIWEGRGDWLLAPIPPPPPFLHLLSYSLTDRWGHLNEVSQEVSSSDSALTDSGGRVPVSRFLHHFTELGEMPLSALSSEWGGQVGKVPSPPAKMYARWHTDDTFAPLKSAEGGYEVRRIDSRWMRTISCHTHSEQWGQEVTLLTACQKSIPY